MACKVCGGNSWVKNGLVQLTGKQVQRWQCKECGARTTDTSQVTVTK